MGLVLKYVKRTNTGGFEYRRRVPKDIADQVAKREFKRVLGRSEREALRSYPHTHDQFERQIAEARALISQHDAARSGELGHAELWEVAVRSVDDMLEGSSDRDEVRNILAESILDKYPRNPPSEDGEGEPVGVSELDRLITTILTDPDAAQPKPTLQDAIELYRGDKYGGERLDEHRSDHQRLDRIAKHACEALGSFPILENLRRDDARKFRDFLSAQRKQNGKLISPASVKRELTIIRAIVTHGLREFDIRGDVKNPFAELSVQGANVVFDGMAENERRVPLPSSVIKAMRVQLSGNRLPELLLIWRLLEGTGCRLAEIVGLRLKDVVIDQQVPHLIVAPHEGRRLKSASSKRLVPLVGDSLEAAREALRIAPAGTALFPRYMRPRGSDAVSATLMRHLKRVRTDERETLHSLRHNMKDALRLAGISKVEQDLLLGHTSSDVGERFYGGSEARLKVVNRAVERALKVHASAMVLGGRRV